MLWIYGDWHDAETVHVTPVEPAERAAELGEMDSEVIAQDVALAGEANVKIETKTNTVNANSFFTFYLSLVGIY